MSDICEYCEDKGGWLSTHYYCKKEGRYLEDIRELESFSDQSQFCKNYNYKDCPIYSGSSSSGGCYITTAVANRRGLPDNCRELTVLRSFRDNYMLKLEGGSGEIAEYYRCAPKIVESIDSQSDKEAIYDELYIKWILPCIELIENNRYEAAHMMYREMVLELNKKYPDKNNGEDYEKFRVG